VQVLVRWETERLPEVPVEGPQEAAEVEVVAVVAVILSEDSQAVRRVDPDPEAHLLLLLALAAQVCQVGRAAPEQGSLG
jgi:hypothetical protein